MTDEKHEDSLLESQEMRAGLLSDMEDDEEYGLKPEKEARRAPNAKRTRYYILVCTFFSLAFGLFAVALVQIGTKLRGEVHTGDEHYATEASRWPTGIALSTTGMPMDCGATDTEAVANGCIFDVMIFAWIPPACYEADLAKEVVDPTSQLANYRAAGTYQWHGGPNFTNPLPQDAEILRHYDIVWATQKWHQAHCMYFWRLLTRAVVRVSQEGFQRAYLLSLGTDYEHTLHCNRILGDRVLPDNDQIRTLKFFGKCLRVDAKPESYLEHGSIKVEPKS